MEKGKYILICDNNELSNYYCDNNPTIHCFGFIVTFNRKYMKMEMECGKKILKLNKSSKNNFIFINLFY
jgi:hypothetical protein